MFVIHNSIPINHFRVIHKDIQNGLTCVIRRHYNLHMTQNQRKSYIFPIRLTPSQKSQIEEMAKRVGKNPTDFIRDLIFLELGRHIGKSGEAA